MGAAASDEAARFGGGNGRGTGRMDRLRQAALGDLTPAQVRQRGLRLDQPVEEEEEGQEEQDDQWQLGDEPEQGVNEEPEPEPAAPPPRPRQGAPKQTALTLNVTAIEDTDHLWDWIRQDAGQGRVFFQRPLSNSMELHTLMRGLVDAEQSATGLVRSVYVGSDHIGTLMLVPILTAEKVALVHLYLRPDVRPSLAHIASTVLQQAMHMLPGYHLAVFALDDTWRQLQRRILAPLGFAEMTMFVR